MEICSFPRFNSLFDIL